MNPWVWKAVKVLVSLSCGSVVIFGPSEVDQLAIGQALPRAVAVAMLAVIAVTAMAAAVAPARRVHVRTCALRLGGVNLIVYGAFAALLKGLVALPTAGLAVVVGLLFLDRAAALAVARAQVTER